MPVPEAGVGSKRRASFAEEWRVLRAVARADGSVGRILDGHFNGVERVSVLAPSRCAQRTHSCRRRAPAPRVGARTPYPGRYTGPAQQEDQRRLLTGRRQDILQRRDGHRPRARGRTRGGGAAGSPAARVRGPLRRREDRRRVVQGLWDALVGEPPHSLRRSSVLAVLGEPGELVREPYFGRDAIRTAVTWAGIADTAVEGL